MSRGLEILKDRRLVLCLGPGGVGKTTISAALSLRGVLEGQSVDVMTVDPAPRLLDALGLDARNPEPQPVAVDGLRAARNGAAPRLRALKLDPKRTFDRLVERYAPSEIVRETILKNSLYRNLSEALSGVGDYMAIEKMLELCGDPEIDLVVLDTPPSREALDFLDAPRRLLELLNSRAATLLGASQGFLGQARRLSDLAARAVLSAFDRLAGLNLLNDVQQFVLGFESMYAGFAERAEAANRVLRDSHTLVAVVTTAEELRVEEARLFVESLGSAGIPVGAIVVNRMMASMPALATLAKSKLDPELKKKLRHNWHDFAALKEREGNSLKALRDLLPAGAALLVSEELAHEPRSLADLIAIARSLRAAG